MSIAIVGAGIGGLTAAIALLRHGHDVTVFEQAPALREIGAGVQIGPNGIKVLRALRLDGAVIERSVEPGAHVLRGWKNGETLYATRIHGVFEDKFGAGYYQIHRADLHEILARELSAAHIRLNARVTSVRNEKHRAVLRLADGSEVAFDAVIGADGIHSVVREALLGRDVPRFTGNICWRGIVPVEALPDGLIAREVNVWLGPHGHIVHYYVRKGALVNFVAITEADDWRQESWSATADKSELLSTYAGWNDSLLTLFLHAARVNKWALYDRDPLPRWTDGRITLLGDAAHPMLPYLAQGACRGCPALC